MGPAEPAGYSAAVWDIAVPSGPGRVPGVQMAGFRQRAPLPLELSVVPYPAVTLIIDVRDGITVVDEGRGQRHRGSVAAGLAPGPVQCSGTDADCLQVRLSPVTAHAVLGDPADLGGAVISLGDLWGRDAFRLEERMRTARSWNERFALAEAAFARRMDDGRAADPEVAFVWRQLRASRGQARVERLAEDTGWSRKRLWSRFRAQVGISPKRAASLVRFDCAVHRLAAGEPPVAVAAGSGYADQSHLHRDVKAFAGVTPAAAAVAPWLAVDDIAWSPRGHLPAAPLRAARKPA